jgi:protein SCO1/2
MILAAGGAAAIAIGGGAGALMLRGGDRAFAHCTGGSVAGGMAQIGGPFELVRSDGVTVTDKEVIDRLSLVYFGYTYCPDVCPIDLVRNADAIDRLAEMGHKVRPVFITVDPARDTPEVIGEYAGYMHEEMIGLTGSEEQVEVAKRAYKAFGQKQPGDAESYLVSHSTHSYLMHPDHGMLDFFRNTESADDMANRIACFAAAV